MTLIEDLQPIRGRCALCRCRAKSRVYGIKVCTYHVTHGESDRPCPYCLQSRLFDPRWTYTVTGELKPAKVAVRQVTHPNTIFLDNTGEAVLKVLAVPEPAPRGWATVMRPSVVMISVGVQMATSFVITQWGSDWERELQEAARPVLALCSRFYVEGMTDVQALAGGRSHGTVPWPTVDLRAKTWNVRTILDAQQIALPPRPIEVPVSTQRSSWNRRTAEAREPIWQAQYWEVMALALRVFQIEWPTCEHEWDEQPGEPPMDVCIRCGEVRR